MPEVIASILARDPVELLRQAHMATMTGADWLEIRLDALSSDFEPRKLLADIRLPVLVACRTPRDGGEYRGSAELRREILQRWVDAGISGIDLEAWEAWVPNGVERLSVVIRSYHNLTGIDPNLTAIRDHLLSMGASLAKIAVTAHDLVDAAPVLDLLGHTDQHTEPTVAFAMGEDAWPTRVLACVYGARFAYAAVGDGLATAPGQSTVQDLTGLYDVRRLTRSTAIYGVLGNPARDSWSPLIHNRAFRRLDTDAIYLPFTTSHPEAAVAMLSGRRLRGLSVTAPHKTVLVPQCHQVDEETKRTGALNTLSFWAHGVVRGNNTDVIGVREALLGAGFSANKGLGVVLGGGGAARAGALALSQLGMSVTMMPRSLEPVRDFARDNGFQLARLDADLLSELRPAAVVHATPVGGASDPDGQVVPDWKIAPGTHVLDMGYHNPRTPLLRAVADAGGVPVPGIGMFLAQAREQIYHFTGRRLPVGVLADMVGGL